MSDHNGLSKLLENRAPASTSRQIQAIVAGWAAATSANVVLYFVLKEIFNVPFIELNQFPPPEVTHLFVTEVVIFSSIFSAGAGLVFLIITNIASKPAPWFVGLSVGVLAISFLPPLQIPTPPIPMATKWSLVSMHVLGAGVLIPTFVLMGLPRGSNAI